MGERDANPSKRTALVVTRHPPTNQRVMQALGSAGLTVRVQEEFPPGPVAVDVLVIDLDLSADAVATMIERARTIAPGAVIYAVAEANARARMFEALFEPSVDHVLSKRSAPPLHSGGAGRTLGPDPHSLFTSARRLLEPPAYAGVAAYLLPGSPIHEVVIQGSSGVAGVFTAITTYLTSLGVPESKLRYIDAVLDELLSNALYDAPRDAEGEARHNRLAPVTLADNERVVINFGCDGQHLAIAVRDPFGTLERYIVVDRLRAAAAGKLKPRAAGGAGLGLAMVCSMVSQLIFGVTPSRETEVIALLRVAGTNREALEHGTSVHFHTPSRGTSA